jgi:predicted transglutaminase-like cysteine proteinase
MLVILRTGTRKYQQSVYLSGMSTLGAYLSDKSILGSAPHRVSAMALDALSTMTGRTEKVKSVDDRVAVIGNYILAGEKTKKARIIAGMATADFCGTEWCVTPHQTAGEIDAIHGFINRNIRYLEDPLNYDTFDSADRTIELAFGDCDDIAIVAGAVFLHAGYPVRIKVIRTRGNSDFHHVYILVGTPKADPYSWTASDPAYYKSAGEEAPDIQDQKIYDLNKL